MLDHQPHRAGENHGDGACTIQPKLSQDPLPLPLAVADPVLLFDQMAHLPFRPGVLLVQPLPELLFLLFTQTGF